MVLGQLCLLQLQTEKQHTCVEDDPVNTGFHSTEPVDAEANRWLPTIKEV